MTSQLLPIKFVPQLHDDACGIACVAMVTSQSYSQVWRRLAPAPVEDEAAEQYNVREREFLAEHGWWATAQLISPIVLNFDDLNYVVEQEERFDKEVSRSHRIRFVLAFADGAKPNHAVLWDREQKEVVFDPCQGIVSIERLFDFAGPQTYSGFLGFTAFRHQPGNPTMALVKALTKK